VELGQVEGAALAAAHLVAKRQPSRFPDLVRGACPGAAEIAVELTASRSGATGSSSVIRNSADYA
jgi:hypothetical protein